MIFTLPGQATTAILDGAPAGLVLTARLRDGDEILPTVVSVSPRLDAEGDALNAYAALFTAPASLPVQIEWLEDGAIVGTELVALGGAGPAEGFPGYPSTADLVADSEVTELTSLSAVEQDALREMAIQAVERFCGQSFTLYEGSLTVDGSGARELFAPRRIETLTDLEVKGTSIDLTDVLVSPEGDRLHFEQYATSYAVAAMREHWHDTRTFRAGSGTVILTGTFGWSVVPQAVVLAIRIEMEDQAQADANKLAGTVAAFRRLGLRNIAQGNLRADIGNPSDLSPRSAKLLAKYVWTGPGGYLA